MPGVHMERVGNLSVPKVASLYAKVPAEELEKFKIFRRDLPYEELSYDGQVWPYLCGGQGDEALLFLPGALSIPDISWSLIAGFAARRRLIVPAYPPVATMDALVDGIASILRREGLERVPVVGDSYGGAVAQVFVRRHPSLTQALVLSHTQPPVHAMASRARSLASSLHWLPLSSLRRVLRRTFGSMMPQWSDATACTLAIFEEVFDHALDKRDAVGIFERMADFSRRSFTARDLNGWEGRVLLIFGEADPATPPALRQALAALYPGSLQRVFEGTGIETTVLRRDEYIAVIEGFLSRG
jgi:pimeloyl-ACP methyl ester carboxylesterase